MGVNNSLANKVQTAPFSVFLTQDAVSKKINEVVGGKDGQRFMTSILSAVTTNPDLQRCNHMSILNCAFLGESLKLSPSPQLGQFYMVPFDKKDRNGDVIETNATFVLGYKGYIQLALRSGYYKKINVLAIKDGELKAFDPLNETIDCILIDDFDKREAAPTIGYYVMFEYLNGFRKAMYWSIKQMEKHANTYSAAFNLEKHKLLMDGKIPKSDMWKYSSYWYKDFDGMAYKTMLRQIISKWGIMSTEMQRAFESDGTFTDANGGINYVENDETPTQPIEPEIIDDHKPTQQAQKGFFEGAEG